MNIQSRDQSNGMLGRISHSVRKNVRTAAVVRANLVHNMFSAVWTVNVQSFLHENVVFSVCASMGNAANIIFIMWNSISGLDAWYHIQFNISCGVAVTVRSHQEKFQVTLYGEGRGSK